MSAVIQVEAVSKRYRIGMHGGAYLTLRELLASRFGGERDAAERETWALRDVSFDVRQGEAVGVIGANGAGKSTLLKILARITHPTSGVSRTRGRVGSLLEVGTGFHPELTGRENVFLNGAILGMSRRETAARFDEIAEFSGVERFLDTPLKRYSSGMHLRLAFAVAAHLEPEIMIVDEVLAVGDARFRDKCLGKMSELGREGRTVLFVSHDLGAVTQLCPRAIWIDGGRVRADGAGVEIVESYLSDSLSKVSGRTFEPDLERPVQLLSARVVDEQGAPAAHHTRDNPLALAVRFAVRAPIHPLSVAFILHNDAGSVVIDEDWGYDTGSELDVSITPTEFEARLTVPPVLPAGNYRLEIWIGTPFETSLREEALTFHIAPRADDSAASVSRRRSIQVPVVWNVARVGEREHA